MPFRRQGGLRARLFLAHLLVIVVGAATLFLVNSLKERAAPLTVRNAHARLHKALEVAVRNSYIARNVAANTELPPVPKAPIRPLSFDFKQVLKEAGLPKIRFHDLRHAAATLMLADGVSLVTVSKILGHSSPSITARFTPTPSMSRSLRQLRGCRSG